ncbi:MAG: hypothetical protein M3Y74_03330 [Chloroflexota bacterium]|nr:hypothetical protein [Chloroflexota bacterium]
MIGAITPLVQVVDKRTRWLRALMWYAAGALMGSMAFGATLGWLGSVLPPAAHSPGALLVVALAGIVLALCDFGLGRTSTPTLRRQTYPGWWHMLGPPRALFLWGVDLGLGFTTIRVASLYWIVVLVAVALATPATGAAIFGAYGIALALNLGLGVLLFGRVSHGTRANIVALRLSRPLKPALATTLLAWSALLIILVR